MAELRGQKAPFVSAPVFGGNPIAVDGKSVFAIGGAKSGTGLIKPLIEDMMGRHIIACERILPSHLW